MHFHPSTVNKILNITGPTLHTCALTNDNNNIKNWKNFLVHIYFSYLTINQAVNVTVYIDSMRCGEFKALSEYEGIRIMLNNQKHLTIIA